MSQTRAGYRSDIEGLRGVAILLVVLFHAGVSWLAGGFVGVDVFFVLSGYFITGLLVKEQEETGNVNLTEFYARRALRLLPSQLVVLFATLAGVMWLYAPIDRAPIAAHARAAAMSSGNIAFASAAVDYFSSGENPFLHTWSLAVEQQFYFFWPLFIVLVCMVWSTKLARKPMLIGIAISGVLSFAASLWLTSHAQPWAFFGMPTRVWEFALGGALALLLPAPGLLHDDRATWLQFAGLVMVALAVLMYDRATPYPGIAALLPAFGAVLLLVGGHVSPDGVIAHALSASWLRWLGKLSYNWYLWHWPLVGIGGVINPAIGVWGKLAWCAAALVLAWLTHRYVEIPAREGRLGRMPAASIAQLSIAAGAGAALLAYGAVLWAERRAREPEQQRFADAREDRMAHDCWASSGNGVQGRCEFGDKRSNKTLVLLGDSHAEHWLGGLDRAGREHGWKIVVMVMGGCPVAEIPEFMHARRKRIYLECTQFREAMVRRILALHPTAAILSSYDHYVPADGDGDRWQVTSDMWRDGLRRTYARLSTAGIPVVAMRGTPRTWFNVPGCLSRRAAELPFAGDCAYERESAFIPEAVAAQTEAARGLRVRFVDMNDQICPTARCSVVRNGVIVYTDDNHLTASFSRSVAGVLGERISSALEALR